MELEEAVIHTITIDNNPHGTRFWWVCSCGNKGKQVFFKGYAERAGSHHLRDVK